MKKKYIVGLIASILSFPVLSESILFQDDKKDDKKNEETLEVDVKSDGTKQADTTEPSELVTSNKTNEDVPLVEGPSPHLTFHMGLAAEGQNFVGGSIENRGKVSVHGGYIVILPIDEKCNPLTPILHQFGMIKSGEILPFRAPVQAPLSAYRVIGFNAYDDMGFQIDSVDDTLEIIAKRMPEERKACESNRLQTP